MGEIAEEMERTMPQSLEECEEECDCQLGETCDICNPNP